MSEYICSEALESAILEGISLNTTSICNLETNQKTILENQKIILEKLDTLISRKKKENTKLDHTPICQVTSTRPTIQQSNQSSCFSKKPKDNFEPKRQALQKPVKSKPPRKAKATEAPINMMKLKQKLESRKNALFK